LVVDSITLNQFIEGIAMQITCSNCKKVYQVDTGRIPPGVTGTRCRACGNSIPLRQDAPQTPPALAAQAPPTAPEPAQAQPTGAEMMKISCQYCSQKYQINPKSIPEGMTSTRCKSCGHTISLKPRVAGPAQSDPVKSAQQNTGTREIACLFCGKKYRFDAAKIPPGMTTTQCKACGRNLSLTPAAGLGFAFKDEISKKAPPPKSLETPKPKQTQPVAIIQNLEPAKSAVWRRPLAMVAAAVLVVLCIGFYYGGSKLSNLAKETIRAEKSFNNEREAPVKKQQSVAIARQEPRREPFMALNVNIPLLMEAIDRNLPEEKKGIQYQMTTRILQSFGLSRFQLYLYPDPEYTFLPVILAESQKGQSFEKTLKSQGYYIQFLEPVSEGVYRINKYAIPEDKQNNFPIDRYRIQFVEHTAVFAPENLMAAFTAEQNPVPDTQVAQMIASIAGPRDLAALSVRIPENFSNNWQKKIQSNSAFQQNPQAAMMAAMGSGVLAQLSEPLKSVESLAVGFAVDETNGRVLRYAQQFRKGVDGGRVYQQLQSGKPSDLDDNDMVLKLIELFNDPRYRHTIGHKDNRLKLELNWEEQHDKAFWAALSQATLGQLFTGGMALAPAEGPVTDGYHASPKLSSNAEVDDMIKTAPAEVQ
jgi:DNA-directed RNA polymerase subunit RPC12/RpoP